MNEMKPDDKEALNELLRGVAFGIGISVVFLVIIFASGIVTTETAKDSSSSAKVVDTYQGCDVVQYLPEYSGRYYFFLHCSSKY